MLRPLFILFLFFKMSLCFSDIGKWILPLSGDNCKFQLAKSLFKDSKLIIVLHCDVVEPTNITVSHVWSPTSCSPDYFHYFEQRVIDCSRRTLRSAPGESNGTLLQGGNKVYTCHGKESHIIQDDKATVSDSAAKQTIVSQSKVPPLAVVEKEGVYELVMSVWSETKFNLTVSVEMVAPSGYLSAAMWPLLPFFGVMCGVYSCACGGWLLVCALQWRDLLRIQYWIGAVALLGMLESAVYYAVYAAINRTGFFNIEAYMFAEWLSVAKRALARMLVIIVSLGFGIVK
ncbi:transmembrane protein 87A-like [Aphomia sociella]